MPGRHRADDAAVPADLRALLEAVDAIGSDLDLASVLRRIVESACALTDAEFGVLATVDEEGRFTDLVVHGMPGDAIARIGRMPVGHGLLGEVPRQKRTVRVEHVSEHPDFVGLPGAHPPIDSFLGAPVLTGDQAFGHLYLGNKRGDLPFSEVDQSLVEAFARSAGTVLRNALVLAESERRRQWLEGSARVAAALDPALPVEDALERVVSGVLEVSHARLVAVVQDSGLDWQVVAAAAVGAPDDDVAVERAERLVAALGEELRDASQSGELVCVERGDDLRRVALAAPLRTELADTGVLLVETAGDWDALRTLERDLFVSFADQVSLALDRAFALRERGDLLLAADRDRIGRDLHDQVIQRLYATGLQLQAASRADDTEHMRSGVGAAIKEIDLSIRDIRAAIFELGRGTGPELRDNVRSLLSEYACVLGFLPALRTSGPVESALAPAVADQLLVTLREALSNVVRHARATSVTVELTASPEWFMARVVDDGVGLGGDPGPRSGLRNAAIRAEKLGGVLRVGNVQPHGVSVVWLVPAGG